jgi:hypothetical protein
MVHDTKPKKYNICKCYWVPGTESVLKEKTIIAQLVNKCAAFYAQPRNTQELANVPYPEPDKSNSQAYTIQATSVP